jgi:uroporphyrinogen-III decarboxylase
VNDPAKSDISRLLAALAHRKADRAPNFEILLDDRTTRHLLGLSPGDERTTLWTLPPAEAVRLVRMVGQDAVPCSMTWTLRENGCILSHEDADRLLVPPDPRAARAKLQTYIEATQTTSRTASETGVGVVARLSGPMTCSYMALGPVPIESFMYLLYDQPALVERVMDAFLDYHLRLIDAIADLPYHLYYIGDDIASSTGPLISPADLERLWAPRTERLVRAALATGRPIIFHCCGKLDTILPYLVKWGVQAVHPIQPVANDIYAIHARWGDRLTLVGNIDVDAVLTRGTPEEVRADVHEHVRRLGGSGGYVVCSSHSIIDSIPPENYLAMVKAARECGSHR